MPSAVRIGDTNQAGGRVIDGALNVFVNGRPVCTHVSSVTPHACCGGKGCSAHCYAVTTAGSFTVFANNMPVVFVGVMDSCGHTRIQGSPNVFVGV
jgi:uncharacterized Zn-binding protein involved in type VI secretion